MGELRVRKTRFWWRSRQLWWEYPHGFGKLSSPVPLISGQWPKMGTAGGPAVTSHGHVQPSCGWEWRSGQLRDEPWQQEPKKNGGNGTREAIPLLLTWTQSSLCLCLPVNQRKLPLRALRLPAPSAVFCFSKIQIFWRDFSILLWEQKSYRESEASQRK